MIVLVTELHCEVIANEYHFETISESPKFRALQIVIIFLGDQRIFNFVGMMKVRASCTIKFSEKFSVF